MRILFSTILMAIFLAKGTAQNTPVIFDHDGGIDDLLSLLLVSRIPNIDLLGVCVTPADCFLESATSSSLKLLKLAGKEKVRIAQGTVRPVNPFPTEWRAQPMVVNALPQTILLTTDSSGIAPVPAHEFISQQLEDSASPVTFLITGPCSNLVLALEQHPGLKAKVKEVIWMGGAVDTGGNVATFQHNSSAEWNAYWDPFATKKLLGMGLDVKLIALDVTNSVPVKMDFLRRLAGQAEYPLSNLASQMWATTVNTIPGYEYTYFMWDVLATSYLGIPDAFTFERAELAVSTKFPNEGQTYRSPGNGRWVGLAEKVDVERFYEFILDLLAGGGDK